MSWGREVGVVTERERAREEIFVFEAAVDGESGGESEERTDCGMHDLPTLS